MTKAFFFVSILLTAIAMAAGLAHLFELPTKMGLSREEYFTVQQIYRGWALLGIAVTGALIATVFLTVLLRHDPRVFYLALAALICIALSLAIFFTFTFPTNQATRNWTSMTANWQELRARWEYSHAAGALLYFIAFNALVLAALRYR